MVLGLKKEKKKQTFFKLKIGAESFYCGSPLYSVECNDGCRTSAFLDYNRMLEIGKIYRVPGYSALDKNNNLVIISGQAYSIFEEKLSQFARISRL